MGAIAIILLVSFLGFGALYFLSQWKLALYICWITGFALICVFGAICDIGYKKEIAREVLNEVNDSGILEKTHDE